MPSPFPGMNPYLERESVWRDFHSSFLVYAREALTPQLRPRYFVGVEEHLYVHEPADAERRRLVGWADIGVARTRTDVEPSPGVATLAPVEGLIPQPAVERQKYLAIRDGDNRDVVTVVELLSPTNKNSGGEQFQAKREEVLDSPAHYVEIDLLRGGHRPPVEGLPLCHYYALVSRAGTRPRAGLWPIQLRDRLPVVPIPLQGADADAMLDLQAVLNRAFDAAGYDDIYARPPQPRLGPDDAAWAVQFVSAQP